MFRGILLDDLKNKPSDTGEKKPCGRQKVAIPLILLAALLLMGAGFVVIYLTSTQRGGSGISSKRNVSIQLSDEEFVLKDVDGNTTDEFAPGTLVNVAPKIENTGDISAFVFLRMEVPYGIADDGTVVEFFQYQQSSAWTELDDCKEIYNTVKGYDKTKLMNICLPGMTSVNGSVGGENWCVYADLNPYCDTAAIMAKTASSTNTSVTARTA